ncbi:ABC transporter permease [Enterococcus durans]|uniref:ABC transporter permease n=2 Tax=Enterococcus durans TaxID=53345 RepID=A0A5N0YVQ7_9ENTE|nr:MULTISPECIES: ABC transporter permease [Enterococcus]KAA9180835.1 ABC transporter permease [Enterococcus durans]KAA9188645.1 ABC transporter permease [Enterococcus durans]KAA9189063.1 ABC transporter permease [Enterococcus durans]KAA9190070.1 ABC transporter permease [Enterococcus durans]KAA9195034.1 ABC transporter permease [Enterococcus durans]
MIISIKNYVGLNLKELVKNGLFLLGILAAIGPAFAIYYCIKELGGAESFNIKHVSNFYVMLGFLFAVIQPLYLIGRDFTSKTITLVNNSQENRKNYFISNLIIGSLIGIIFSGIGVGFLLFAKKHGVTGNLDVEFLISFILNFIMVVLLYYLIGYFMFTLNIGAPVIYVALSILLLFLPNILTNIIAMNPDSLFSKIVEILPFYSLPMVAASKVLTITQEVVAFLVTILMIGMVYISNGRYEA